MRHAYLPLIGSIAKRYLARGPICLLLSIALAACGGGGGGSQGSNTGATAPSIATQPANQTVSVGQTATFSVTANGTAPLSYQWKKGGTAISGATSASYTTPAVQASDDGTTFVVTVTNATGSVSSSAATLKVTTGTIPPTSLSCDGYQTTTQFCLLLPVEYAQVTPGINVTSEGGDITTHGTGPSDSYVVYTRVIAQAASQDAAKALAHSVVVTITPEGKISASPDHEDFPEMLNIDFEIFTLGSTNVTSNSAGGNLAADHYNATLNLTTAGGSIQLDTVQGNATVHSDGGDLKLDTVNGNINATTGGGAIQLNTVQGTVIAKTGGGNLKLDTVDGNITATTDGGSIGITLTGTGWTGPGLNATSQGGSIVLTRPAGYQAAFTAQSTSGTVSIDGNSVSPPTNPVKLTAGSGAPITLETQGGNVTVTVAQ